MVLKGKTVSIGWQKTLEKSRQFLIFLSADFVLAIKNIAPTACKRKKESAGVLVMCFWKWNVQTRDTR